MICVNDRCTQTLGSYGVLELLGQTVSKGCVMFSLMESTCMLLKCLRVKCLDGEGICGLIDR